MQSLRWLTGVWIVALLVGLGWITWEQPPRVVLPTSEAPPVPPATPAPVPAATPASPTRARIQAAYGKLPLYFEANQGQTDPQVQFLARGAGSTLFLTPTEAVLSLP